MRDGDCERLTGISEKHRQSLAVVIGRPRFHLPTNPLSFPANSLCWVVTTTFCRCVRRERRFAYASSKKLGNNLETIAAENQAKRGTTVQED